ncbi:hypothetical protein P0136_06145 [Lentisphaerota bacterium ZTH]|nr:hypothetical protein JYG24_02745 [Lentisphaerota bacterium]WET07570.1 hypothetical protein P0136_06145 [Lentisphaerota bacterium ZTH]
MRRSLYMTVVFAIMLFTSFILKAEKCGQCGRVLSNTENDLPRMEQTEIEFRKMYSRRLKEFLLEHHSDLISSYGDNNLNIDMLYEFYHVPAKKELYEKPVNTNTSFEVEKRLLFKKLPPSIGDLLPYDEIRADIKDTMSGLKIIPERYSYWESVLDIENSDFDAAELKPICDRCRNGILRLNTQNQPLSFTPRNIQLVMKLNKLIDSSDILIVFEHGRTANFFLTSYFNIFNSKRFVFGVDVFDEELQSSYLKLNTVREIIDDKINQFDGEDNKKDYKVLSKLIAEYGLPLLSMEKYLANRQGAFVDCISENAVRFLETRCPNAFCFGAGSALSNLTESNYNKKIESYPDLFKQLCNELNLSMDKGLSSHKYTLLTNKKDFPKTVTLRKEVAQKIGVFYAAVNRDRSSKNRIPFIILLKDDYGIQKNQEGQIKRPAANEKEMLIQNILKEKLKCLNLRDVKVTTLYAHSSWYNNRFGIFSQRKDELLQALDLDYAVLFSVL